MATNNPSISSRNNPESSAAPIDPSDPLSEELPPAYTAVADTRHGETSVQFGPSRPFQPPPPQPLHPSAPIAPRWQPSPASTSTWFRPSTSGWQSSWSGYPGQLHRSSTSASTLSRPPPPRHPTQGPRDELFPSFTGSSQRSFVAPTPTVSSYAPPPGPPPGQPLIPPTASSDFARDFYSAGASDTALLGGSSNQYSPTRSSPGPSSTERSRSAENLDVPRHPDVAAGSPGIPDDGRPTDKPVPGHPLMNNGRVLVYPAGYQCMKCQNTGYKHYDPSHPCAKCWQKYSKPFSGPIAYAPWGSDASQPHSPHSNLNLQRPLRVLGHRSTSSLTSLPSSSPSGYPGQNSRLSRSATTATARSPPTAGTFPPPHWGDSSAYLGPTNSSSTPQAQYAPPPQRAYTVTSGPPPPGALIVQPGDPRLGGRMCWRCDGTGSVSLFFFDTSRCDVCGGMGRVFA